jgi:putative aldouronate transport system permease protein
MSSEIQTASSISLRTRRGSSLWGHIWKFKVLYLISLPGILYFLIFRYVPLLGMVIAFQKYNIFKGFTGSPWVGMENFVKMFEHYDFLRILKNTIVLGVLDILFVFPAAIFIAILLNELRQVVYKRIVQTVIYMPHFLSWVIISGIAVSVFSPSTGIFNKFINMLGFESIYVLGSESYIRTFLVGSGLWRDVGYSTIIYLAALASVNPELYEAAEIDGANRWKQTMAITIPSILPVIVIMFLLQIGHFLDYGFERVWVFLNALNNQNGEILDTYIYRVGILSQQYSYTTAIGIFKSVVGLTLLLIGNALSKKATGESLF